MCYHLISLEKEQQVLKHVGDTAGVYIWSLGAVFLFAEMWHVYITNVLGCCYFSVQKNDVSTGFFFFFFFRFEASWYIKGSAMSLIIFTPGIYWQAGCLMLRAHCHFVFHLQKTRFLLHSHALANAWQHSPICTAI